MLTAQEAIELSLAFPYARGRRQLPLGERVLVNDHLRDSPIPTSREGPQARPTVWSSCRCRSHRGHGG